MDSEKNWKEVLLKRERWMQLKNFNMIPTFVIPHFKGHRKTKQINGGLKNLYDHSIQNGGL